MVSYRLIDELPDAKSKRPPWSPLGLFFLTWLWLPVGVPFWIFNWARLGQPEKRLATLGLGLSAFAVPFGLLAARVPLEATRFLATLAMMAFASFELWHQRPLYDAHLRRGAAKAAVWPLWVAALASAAGQWALGR